MGVPRREFRKVRWLTADMNVAPAYTLDAVESIVTHAEVNIRGLVLTLKLPEWTLAEHIPEYLEQTRELGLQLGPRAAAPVQPPRVLRGGPTDALPEKGPEIAPKSNKRDTPPASETTPCRRPATRNGTGFVTILRLPGR